MIVWQELWAALKRYPLWTRLAFMDIKETYRRSFIGIAWIMLSFGMFIGVKILVFGNFLPPSVGARVFTAHLTIGFWLWVFISESVVDGANVYVRSRGWLLGTDIATPVFVFQSVFRVIIRFMYTAPIVVAVLVLSRWVPTPLWLVSLAGLIVFVLNALWVHFLLGILCARYRDLTYFLQAIMRVLFFLTPILYLPSMLGELEYILNYNPFTHFLAIVRDPIVYDVFPVLAWQVVGSITVLGWVAAIIAMKVSGRRVQFWV